MYFTHDDQEHEPYTPGVSSGTQHMFPIQESRSPPPRSVTSTSSESCFSVSENDRDELIQLYTQHKQVTKSLKKFRGKKPYRPTQSKKRWITSTNSSTQNKPMFKKVFLLEDDGELVELNPEDQELYFASFAKKTTSSSTTHNPNKFKVPGGNPIDRKTGKRMLCNTCQSPDHFERDCKSSAPKTGSLCLMTMAMKLWLPQLMTLSLISVCDFQIILNQFFVMRVPLQVATSNHLMCLLRLLHALHSAHMQQPPPHMATAPRGQINYVGVLQTGKEQFLIAIASNLIRLAAMLMVILRH